MTRDFSPLIKRVLVGVILFTKTVGGVKNSALRDQAAVTVCVMPLLLINQLVS